MAKTIEKLLPTIGYHNSTYTYEGTIVPRVTEIISKCVHSDSLMYWANSLGFKRQSYKKTLAKAADIGTECHETIDSFLSDELDDTIVFTHYEANCAYESFQQWWRDINRGNNIKVLLHEYTLVCKYFGGTLDGLYEINGKKYLVDYKTSNHVTFKYCLQAAAYRYMLREILGIELDGVIILQLSKTNVSYNENVIDLHDPEQLAYMNQCEQTFFSLVLAFYHLYKTESEYSVLNWRY